MAIEGPLKELGIHDVFALLDLSRKTGVLRVTSELRRNEGTIYFDAGAVIYAEIRSNPHRLGELLLRAGKISEADLRRARDMQEQGDERQLGAILVAIGAITARELERHVRFQVEEVVFEIMSWREGHFAFVEGAAAGAPTGAGTRIPTDALLMEGARRIDEWSRIESVIPHLGVVPALAPTAGGESTVLDLRPAEWEVVAAIDGERDVRAIAESLGQSEFEIAKTVFGLAAAGIVEITDPGRRSLARGAERTEGLDEPLERVERALSAGDVAAARAAAEAVAAAHPHAAAVHLALGRVDLAARRGGDAEGHLRRALRLDAMLLDAHRYMGDALALQGRFAEAIQWWERWQTMGAHGDLDPAIAERVAAVVQAARTLHAALAEAHV